MEVRARSSALTYRHAPDIIFAAMGMPSTSMTLLARLRREDDQPEWQNSWRRFLELYNDPLMAMAAGIYQHHTNGATASQPVLEDIVAQVVADFHQKNRFDPKRGRLRAYLRMLVNARVVDLLRKDRPLNYVPLPVDETELINALPPESPGESEDWVTAILATLIEDLRDTVPLRHFEIFERVKLQHRSPDEVAAELGVKRGVVDNTIYKVMGKLRELASRPEYREEYHS